MPFKINILGLDKLGVELQTAARSGINIGLQRIGVRGQRLVQDNIGSPYDGLPPAVATGNLLNSVFYEVQPGPVVSRVIIGAGAPADVYAPPVETGTRPHMPPPSALLPWVMMKFRPDTDRQALSIAFAIAKSIARRGTRGHFMFQRALEQIMAEAQAIMETAVAQQIKASGGVK